MNTDNVTKEFLIELIERQDRLIQDYVEYVKKQDEHIDKLLALAKAATNSLKDALK